MLLKVWSEDAPRLRTLEEIKERVKTHPLYQPFPEDYFSKHTITKAHFVRTIEHVEQEDPNFWNGSYISLSGGTGGAGEYFPSDIRENKLQRWTLAKQMIEFRVFSPDRVYCNMFVASNMYRSMEIFNEFCEIAGATVLPMGDASDNYHQVYLRCKRFKASVLMAPPSRLVMYALYLKQNNLIDSHPKISQLIFAGETMFYSKRELLRQVFGEHVEFVGLYGSAESGVWSFQPPFLAGTNRYLYLPELMHIDVVSTSELQEHQILDDLSENNNEGRLILTNLVKYKYPLARFDSGDIGNVEIIEYNGIPYHSIVLSGRKDRVLNIGNRLMPLSDIVECILNAKWAHIVLEWQLHISVSEDLKLDLLEVLVVLVPDNALEGKIITEEINKLLVELFTEKVYELFVNISVRSVASETLTRNPSSAKIYPVVDFRK